MPGSVLRRARTGSGVVDVECVLDRYTSSGMGRGLVLSSGWWCLLLVLTVVQGCTAGVIRYEDGLQSPTGTTTVKPAPFAGYGDIFPRLDTSDPFTSNIYNKLSDLDLDNSHINLDDIYNKLSDLDLDNSHTNLDDIYNKLSHSNLDNIDTSLFDIYNKQSNSDFDNIDTNLFKPFNSDAPTFAINDNFKPLNFDVATPPPPTYSYTRHRIIFVPFGAIIFLIALCLRMCLCKRPKPAVAMVRTVAIIVPPEQEVTSGTTDLSDKPPSYADVQKEDLPPPYTEVTPNPPEGQDAPPSAPTHEASPSPSEDEHPTRPVLERFRSQYNYKPLE